jgi:HPt (histidine-containing phosphotransfer) domain-containing protein
LIATKPHGKFNVNDLSGNHSLQTQLDSAILTELLEVLGAETLMVALGKFLSDTNSSLEELRLIRDFEAQSRTAHRLKGLMNQFGALEAARLAQDMEFSATLRNQDELRRFENEMRRAAKTVCDTAADLIGKGNPNG